MRTRPAVTILETKFRFAPTPIVVRKLGARNLEPAALTHLLQAYRPVDVPSVFLTASTESTDSDEAWDRMIPAAVLPGNASTGPLVLS